MQEDMTSVIPEEKLKQRISMKMALTMGKEFEKWYCNHWRSFYSRPSVKTILQKFRDERIHEDIVHQLFKHLIYTGKYTVYHKDTTAAWKVYGYIKGVYTNYWIFNYEGKQKAFGTPTELKKAKINDQLPLFNDDALRKIGSHRVKLLCIKDIFMQNNPNTCAFKAESLYEGDYYGSFIIFDNDYQGRNHTINIEDKNYWDAFVRVDWYKYSDDEKKMAIAMAGQKIGVWANVYTGPCQLTEGLPKSAPNIRNMTDNPKLSQCAYDWKHLSALVDFPCIIKRSGNPVKGNVHLFSTEMKTVGDKSFKMDVTFQGVSLMIKQLKEVTEFLQFVFDEVINAPTD